MDKFKLPKIKGYENKTFKELGLTEEEVRSTRSNGWEVAQDIDGNKWATRKKEEDEEEFYREDMEDTREDTSNIPEGFIER